MSVGGEMIFFHFFGECSDKTAIMFLIMTAPINRADYTVRKIPLSEEGSHSDLTELSPSQRVALVWQITAQAWAFKDGIWNEPRLRRDVVCTQRNRG